MPVNRRALLLATAALGGEIRPPTAHRLTRTSQTTRRLSLQDIQPFSHAGSVVAAAEAGNFDNYTTAPSGLKWLDTQEGSGPAPTKGANIRQLQEHQCCCGCMVMWRRRACQSGTMHAAR